MVEGWDGVSARIRYQVPSGRRAQRPRGAWAAREGEPVTVLDRERAVDGLDLVCLWVVIGEPLRGIAGSPGPHSRSHGPWVLSNRES
jgi:hypothetical protein